MSSCFTNRSYLTKACVTCPDFATTLPRSPEPAAAPSLRPTGPAYCRAPAARDALADCRALPHIPAPALRRIARSRILIGRKTSYAHAWRTDLFLPPRRRLCATHFAPREGDEREKPNANPYRQRSKPQRRRRARHPTVVGVARYARHDRHQIRLRHRAVRRLHGPYQRRGDALLLRAVRRRCRPEDHHH